MGGRVFPSHSKLGIRSGLLSDKGRRCFSPVGRWLRRELLSVRAAHRMQAASQSMELHGRIHWVILKDNDVPPSKFECWVRKP
jgi:hypothetical protein